MPIFKRTKDKETGKVTKTFKNPFTGRTRTTTKYTDEKGVKHKKVTTEGRKGKFGETVGAKVKVKTKGKGQAMQKYKDKIKRIGKVDKAVDWYEGKRTSRKEGKGEYAKGGMINRYRGGGIIQHD